MTSAEFGRRYFSRGPHKSLYFWLQTIYLLVVLSMALVFGKHYYDRLSAGALWWMCLSVAAPIILWLRAWKSHARLTELSRTSPGRDLEDRAAFDAVLAEAAYLENAALGVTLFVLMCALIGLSEILPK